MGKVPDTAKVQYMVKVYNIRQVPYTIHHWKIIPSSLLFLSDHMKRVTTAVGIITRGNEIGSSIE